MYQRDLDDVEFIFVQVLMSDEKAVPAIGLQHADALAVAGLEDFNIEVVKAQSFHDGKHVPLSGLPSQAFFPVPGAKKPKTADMLNALLGHVVVEIGDLFQSHVAVFNAGLEKMVYTEPCFPCVIDSAQDDRYAGTEIDVDDISLILDNSLVYINIAELLGPAFLEEKNIFVHDRPIAS